ncbi:MAG: peptide chain release factor N(5)-glutamine methyltransferase [Chloroflexi bacterium]|nr:peptide chain release factor N(5)-glutamine methyltransferase [Chloroflexota bacterium]
MRSLAETLRRAEGAIASGGIPDARLEAELLLMHCLGIDRVELCAGMKRTLAVTDTERYWRLVERRLQREPTAYILNQCQFYGLDLYIDARALIPRPETEMLVEVAVEFAKLHFPAGVPSLVADVGTGSGAIAIALALNLPLATVYAIDISAGALDVARVNCARHRMEERVKLLHGDMLEPLSGPVNIVVANLPYVADSDLPGLMPEVRENEPLVALAGGPDGLVKIRQLLPQAVTKLLPGGLMLLEVGQGQGEAAASLAGSYFPGARVDIIPDLAGIERVVRVLN